MSISTSAKVSPPQLPSFAVLRERLVRRLDDAVGSKVTLIVAPPGYGKSVLLAQWASAGSERRRAWLELGPRDNNATQLARSLLASLRSVFPSVGDAAAELVGTGGEALGDDFVFALLDDLADVPETVIVLDNFEVVRDGALLADIGTLIEHSPEAVHFVVVSRSDAAFGLPRLRMRGALAELRQTDLAMNEDEATELLSRVARVDLPPEDVRVLVRRTEGWPAGLQLAALSLRGQPDPRSFVRSFSGDDRHVADYLTDELLSRQPDDVRAFLVETSILERLSGPLCDAVLGRTGSQAMLESLDRRGLLMIRLDSTRTWFRYHPLLRDLLRFELRASRPERMRELLDRAAAWHLEHGDVAGAGQYVVATEDPDLILEFVTAHGRALFEGGDPGLIVEWLSSLPESLRRERHDVALTWAVLDTMTGRALAADEELTTLLDSGGLTIAEEAVAEAVRSTLVHWHAAPARALTAGARALECLEALGPDDEIVDVLGMTSPAYLRVMARGAMGRAAFFLGDLEGAHHHLQACASGSEGTYRVWLMHALGSAAYLDAYEGSLRSAASLAGRVIDIGFTSDLVSHPASADAHLALAAVLRERRQLDEAALALDEALHRIRRNRRLALLALHTNEAALLALAQGRPDEALNVVERASSASQPPPPPLPAARSMAACARAHLLAGDTKAAAALLAGFDGLRVRDIVAAEVAVAVAQSDGATARHAVDELQAFDDPRGRVRAAMWSAVVDDLEGNAASARANAARAVAIAEPEDLMGELLDAGAPARRLVRGLYHAEPTGFLRAVVDHAVLPAPATPPKVRGLVEQFSDRELIVLRYLPSRLSNPEIARQLYVSVNTLKTHLKHIYRKLEVTSRSEAIAKAEALGLL